MAIGDTVYKGFSFYGRVQSFFGMIVAIIIGIVLFVVGRMLLKNNYTETAVMTITSVVEPCQELKQTNKNGTLKSTSYKCLIGVTFIGTDGKERTASNISVTGQSPVTVGQTISLRYNPSDTTQVAQAVPSKTPSYILFGIGGALICLSVTTFVVSLLSRRYAAFTGGIAAASAAASAFGNVFRRR